MNKNMPFLIESAMLTDLDSLLKIEASVFNLDDGKLSRRSFIQHIKSNHILLTIRDNSTKETIGYILVFCYKLSARIYSFAILPTYQGYGLAKKLLGYALYKIKLLNLTFVKLEVRENNINAIKLYESFGFQTKKVLTNYYGLYQNALSMKLELKIIEND